MPVRTPISPMVGLTANWGFHLSTTRTRRWSGLAALVTVTALVIGAPLAASAATPGVGDVSDAVRYDVAGPFGAPIADLSGEDDDTETLTAPFPINFFGTTSAGLCITTNGGFYPVPTDTDSCNNGYDEDVENLAISSDASMIAALAADIDLDNCVDNTTDGWGIPCEIYFGTTTIDGRDAFVITWYRVSMYEGENDESLDNTFQIVIIKKATGDDIVGWDFDIEFNYATVTDGEDGYSAEDPTEECEGAEGNPDCRWGIGWANYLGGDPEEADGYELFASTPVENLLDGAPTALVSNSLNSAVLGRYTFGMVGGVTVGFAIPQMGPAAAAPALADTGSAAPLVLVGSSLAMLALGGILLVRRRAHA